MSIHFQINIDGETTDEAIAEFRKVFGGLIGAAPAGAGVAAAGSSQQDGEVAAPKKTRNKKDSGPLSGGKETSSTNTPSEKNVSAASQQNSVGPDGPLADASNAEKAESASASSTTETSSTSASDVSSVTGRFIPDIDSLRAKLMSLSKTDGGHDKVFEILGKVGAKNASTVPEDKRGEVVALVDEALAEAK